MTDSHPVHAANDVPVGVFDSGLGGLSVLREIRQHAPSERLLYLADHAHYPYGSRPLADERALSTRGGH